MRQVRFFLLLVLGVSAFGLNVRPVCSEIVIRETADSPETHYGAHLDHDGWVHFVVHAPEATAVNLLLFEKEDARTGPTYGPELFHWTRDLIQLRKKWTHFRRAEFAEYVDQAWDGGAHAGPDNDGKFSYAWEEPGDGRPTQVAVVWWGKAGEPDLMVLYNEDWHERAVTNLATWSGGDWKILAKSWADDAGDFCDLNAWETACAAAGGSLTLPGRSMAVLISSND